MYTPHSWVWLERKGSIEAIREKSRRRAGLLSFMIYSTNHQGKKRQRQQTRNPHTTERAVHSFVFLSFSCSSCAFIAPATCRPRSFLPGPCSFPGAPVPDRGTHFLLLLLLLLQSLLPSW